MATMDIIQNIVVWSKYNCDSISKSVFARDPPKREANPISPEEFVAISVHCRVEVYPQWKVPQYSGVCVFFVLFFLLLNAFLPNPFFPILCF